MRENLVTIIIPVYNTQDYLERCVSSALGQTHHDLQVILINDGSTDGSGRMCDAYAAADSRIEVIHQENAGQSAARNSGLERVKGQWVTFLDADDYFSMHYVEQSLSACLKHGADIAACRSISDYDGSLGEELFALPDNSDNFERISNREAVLMHFGRRAALLNMACCKLYRASLWRGLRFPPGMIWEDVFVSHHILYNAHAVIILGSALYAYCMVPGSTMRKPFSLKRLDALKAWEEGIRFYEQAGEPEFAALARRVYCNRVFDAYGLCKKHLPDERAVHKQLRRQAISAYREAMRIRSYIDLSPKRAFAYRVKQLIGRYCPALYAAMFLRKPTWTL